MLKTAKQHKTIPVQFKDETKVHPALKEYFGYCLFKASAQYRHLMNEALSEHKMQTHHLGILKILEKSGPISQIQLGDELGIDKASMVKLLDHLEKTGHLKRMTDLKDRRIKNIKMTRAGEKAIQICHQTTKKVEEKFFKNLNTTQEKIIKKIVCLLID